MHNLELCEGTGGMAFDLLQADPICKLLVWLLLRCVDCVLVDLCACNKHTRVSEWQEEQEEIAAL